MLTEITAENIEQVINGSFLSRIPEIMERGGFTFEQAVERAYYEDQELIARLSNAAHDRGRDDSYRAVVRGLSNRVYKTLNANQ